MPDTVTSNYNLNTTDLSEGIKAKSIGEFNANWQIIDEELKKLQDEIDAVGTGADGKDGKDGVDGQDGLTTDIKVGDTTYTQVDGTITLPSYATETYVGEEIAKVVTGGEVDLTAYAKKDEVPTIEQFDELGDLINTETELTTADKTVIGAVNELVGDIDGLKAEVNYLQENTATDLQALVTEVNTYGALEFHAGQLITIQDDNQPHLMVVSEEMDNVPYVWVDEDTFLNALDTAPVQIGKYKFKRFIEDVDFTGAVFADEANTFTEEQTFDGGIKVMSEAGICVEADGTDKCTTVKGFHNTVDGADNIKTEVDMGGDLDFITNGHKVLVDGAEIGTGGGSSYDLPIASADVLGGVKIGVGIVQSSDGTISVQTSSGEVAEYTNEFEVISEVFDLASGTAMAINTLDGIDMDYYNTPMLATTDGSGVAWLNLILNNGEFYARNVSDNITVTGAFLVAKKNKGVQGADGINGIDGSDGYNGIDGTSPTVTVDTNTDDEYKLKITDVNGEITTPNLKGSGSSSSGTFGYVFSLEGDDLIFNYAGDDADPDFEIVGDNLILNL